MKIRTPLAGMLLACYAGLAGATLPERYEVRGLDEPGAADAIAECLGGGVARDTIDTFIADNTGDKRVGRQSQLVPERGGAAVIAARSRWACVRLSSDGYPLWPIETLSGLIVPMGVPPEVTAAWRKTMLEQVAREGVARGLIVFPGGNATQINLIGEPRQAMTVKFTTRQLKAGEYQLDQFPAVLSHPDLKGMTTTSEGGDVPSRFAIPTQRLRKPVDGEYVAVAPSGLTHQFAFDDTRWKFGSSGSELSLLPDGVAKMSSRQSTSTGAWKVENGVLHVAFGANGARFAMTLQSDQRTMTGEGRRRDKPTHDEDDGEWQWSFTLQRL